MRLQIVSVINRIITVAGALTAFDELISYEEFPNHEEAFYEYITEYSDKTITTIISVWYTEEGFINDKTNCVCMATITNTVKLYSEKGIRGIITLNRNVNSDNARRKFDGVLRLVLSKSHAVLHRKDIPAGRFVYWKNRQKLYLMFRLAKIQLAGLKKINFDLT